MDEDVSYYRALFVAAERFHWRVGLHAEHRRPMRLTRVSVVDRDGFEIAAARVRPLGGLELPAREILKFLEHQQAA